MGVERGLVWECSRASEGMKGTGVLETRSSAWWAVQPYLLRSGTSTDPGSCRRPPALSRLFLLCTRSPVGADVGCHVQQSPHVLRSSSHRNGP